MVNPSQCSWYNLYRQLLSGEGTCLACDQCALDHNELRNLVARELDREAVVGFALAADGIACTDQILSTRREIDLQYRC